MDDLRRLFEKHQEAQVSGAIKLTSKKKPKPRDVVSDYTGLVQWISSDNVHYTPAARTRKTLLPGCYDPVGTPSGLLLKRLPVSIDGLLRFPQTNCDKVVEEIQSFWERGEIFRHYNLPHKRGILLYGPPGSGKSSLVRLVIRDVIERGGVCFRMTDPGVLVEALRILRAIQYDTPVVILMEDLDAIFGMYNESQVLNLLDGVERIDKVCFLATTNYPEQLGPRVINRPSRFDRLYHIGHPDPVSRMLYLRYLLGENPHSDVEVNLEQWVNDTDGMSLAHLQELFVAVVILGNAYAAALKTLVDMQDQPDSSQDESKKMGFGVTIQNVWGYGDGGDGDGDGDDARMLPF